MTTISPAETDILTTLRTLLLGVLDPSVEVIKGQINRVPEPAGDDFVVMTPIRHSMLWARNLDEYIDTLYNGSISGQTLTVNTLAYGSILPGSPVFGVGITAGTQIIKQLSGTIGGVGTYQVTTPQTVAAETMASGLAEMTQHVDVAVQLDVHGPAGGDNAQIIATILRDEYACEVFEASGFDMDPLYTEDPRQIPFFNENQQAEYRWIVEARIQANQKISVGQQFAAAVIVGLISVDVVYPPEPFLTDDQGNTLTDDNGNPLVAA